MIHYTHNLAWGPALRYSQIEHQMAAEKHFGAIKQVSTNFKGLKLNTVTFLALIAVNLEFSNKR